MDVAIMKPDDIAKIVRREIDEYEYDEPAPGTTLGVPFPEQKIRSYFSELEGALVLPYERNFYLRDTYDQVKEREAAVVTYWVIAETDNYIQFYDPVNEEFGLACEWSAGELPTTIGVRGDLVGVFVAM